MTRNDQEKPKNFIFNLFSGDLYFEKAVDGFLSDMFDKWKQYGSSHEVY